MWLPYFIGKLAAAALSVRLHFELKSLYFCVQAGVLTANGQAVSNPLETYTTDDIIGSDGP